jgi:hypothetical protein
MPKKVSCDADPAGLEDCDGRVAAQCRKICGLDGLVLQCEPNAGRKPCIQTKDPIEEPWPELLVPHLQTYLSDQL